MAESPRTGTPPRPGPSQWSLTFSRSEPGAGRLVARYQVARVGNLSGSVVTTTALRTLSGPYGPASTSRAHHSSRWPSRKARTTFAHLPGSSSLRHPAASAASHSAPMSPSLCHQQCDLFKELGFGTAIPLLESREREFYTTFDA